MILPALRNVKYSFCLHLDAMFHGANVVSIGGGKQTSIETVMELSLPSSFVDCLNSTNNIINDELCARLASTNVSGARSHHRSSRALKHQNYHLQ
jgi:alkyl hydroperoxide reductase subunit AhpF